MADVEQVLKEFQKLPDWNRFPLPEVLYEKFGIKKPQPASLVEVIGYQPPPSESLNPKIEERPPAPGGVREIKEFLQLPVEVKLLDDEGNEKPNVPEPRPVFSYETFISQISGDKKLDLKPAMLTLPTEGTKTESQPESGHESPSLSDV